MARTLTGADGKNGAGDAAETDPAGEPLPIFGGKGPEEIAAQLLKRYFEQGGSGKEEETLMPYEARIWKKELA